MKYFTAALLASSLLGGAAWAQTAGGNPDTPVIDQRLQNQQNRTDQGIASGSLTQNEATRVQNRDASIAAQDQKDVAKDGSNNLTRHQRRALRRRENRTSKAIHRKKHNNVTAAPAQ